MLKRALCALNVLLSALVTRDYSERGLRGCGDECIHNDGRLQRLTRGMFAVELVEPVILARARKT